MALPDELTKDWPAEIKSDPTLKDVNDVLTLAKNLIHTKSFVGASLRPPGPDAKPEERAEFVTKLREKVPELVLIPDGDDEPAKAAREIAWSRLGKPKETKDVTVFGEIHSVFDVGEDDNMDGISPDTEAGSAE